MDVPVVVVMMAFVGIVLVTIAGHRVHLVGRTLGVAVPFDRRSVAVDVADGTDALAVRGDCSLPSVLVVEWSVHRGEVTTPKGLQRV